MTQPEIDAIERGIALENLTKKVEELLPRLEAALAATPAESNAALEKKVESVDQACAEFIRESNDTVQNVKEKVVELAEAMAKLKEEQNTVNVSIDGRLAALETPAPTV